MCIVAVFLTEDGGACKHRLAPCNAASISRKQLLHLRNAHIQRRQVPLVVVMVVCTCWSTRAKIFERAAKMSSTDSPGSRNTFWNPNSSLNGAPFTCSCMPHGNSYIHSKKSVSMWRHTHVMLDGHKHTVEPFIIVVIYGRKRTFVHCILLNVCVYH